MQNFIHLNCLTNFLLPQLVARIPHNLHFPKKKLQNSPFEKKGKNKNTSQLTISWHHHLGFGPWHHQQFLVFSAINANVCNFCKPLKKAKKRRKTTKTLWKCCLLVKLLDIGIFNASGGFQFVYPPEWEFFSAERGSS